MRPVTAVGCIVGLLTVGAVIARLVVSERHARKDAADWQEIARTYRWKIDEHGKSWCVSHPMDAKEWADGG